MKRLVCLMAVILLFGLLVQPARAGDSLSKNMFSVGILAGSSLTSKDLTFPAPISVEGVWAGKDAWGGLGLVAELFSDTTKNVQGVPVNVFGQGVMAMVGFWSNRDRDKGLFDRPEDRGKFGLGNLGLHGYVGYGLFATGANSREFALTHLWNNHYKIGLGVDWKFKAGKEDADLILDFNRTDTVVNLVPVTNGNGFTRANHESFPDFAVQLGVRVWQK